MKKIVFTAVAVVTAMATVALAGHKKPSNDDVEKAIDTRLHAMLVKLNAEKK